MLIIQLINIFPVPSLQKPLGLVDWHLYSLFISQSLYAKPILIKPFHLHLIFRVLRSQMEFHPQQGMYRVLILSDKYCLSLPTARERRKMSGMISSK